MGARESSKQGLDTAQSINCMNLRRQGFQSPMLSVFIVLRSDNHSGYFYSYYCLFPIWNFAGEADECADLYYHYGAALFYRSALCFVLHTILVSVLQGLVFH